MNKILLMFFLYGCSQVSLKRESADNLVSINTALDHIHASYLKGCVDTYKEMKMPVSFELCRDRAKFHLQEVQQIIDFVP